LEYLRVGGKILLKLILKQKIGRDRDSSGLGQGQWLALVNRVMNL
jgi:hypothetical protein